MRSLHPTIQILLWILLVLLLQRWPPTLVLAVSLLCSAVALWLDSTQFLRLLRRTRWIALSLLLVYAWATPGTALLDGFGSLSPTYEGLLDGVLQLGRLLSALASLAILLASLSQERLIGGLYALALPLRLFGLSRERFAVRLALTLDYAETTMHETARDWRVAIAQALALKETEATHINLQKQRYSLLDATMLVICLAVLIGVWR